MLRFVLFLLGVPAPTSEPEAPTATVHQIPQPLPVAVESQLSRHERRYWRSQPKWDAGVRNGGR